MRTRHSFEQHMPFPDFSGQACPRGRDLGANPQALPSCGRGRRVLPQLGRGLLADVNSAQLTAEFQVKKLLEGDNQQACRQQWGLIFLFLLAN